MDITGKIILCSEPRSGQNTRTGNPWKSQDFVIEWYEGNYPRHCNFNVFGEDRLKQFNIQLGQEYTVSVDIDAHEYNGRWFNDIRAFRIDRGQAAPTATTDAAPVAPTAAPAPQAVSEAPAPQAEAAPTIPFEAPSATDDLPF